MADEKANGAAIKEPIKNAWPGCSSVSVSGLHQRRSIGVGFRGPGVGRQVAYDVRNLLRFGRLPIVYQRDVKGHWGCVNAIQFSHDERLFVSGGDDTRVLLWAANSLLTDEKPRPLMEMKEQHHSNIFTYAFSIDDTRVYSGANDCRCLVHDVATGNKLAVYQLDARNGHRMYHQYPSPVYSISEHPGIESVVAVGWESGGVHLFDHRESEQHPSTSITFDDDVSLYGIQFNPVKHNQLAVCTDPRGTLVYDIRNAKDPMLDLSLGTNEKAMFADWSEDGRSLAIVRSLSTPAVIYPDEKRVVFLEDDNYSNQHTVKSCVFIEGETVVTGGDDFDIYLWNIDDMKNLENKGEEEEEHVIRLGNKFSVSRIAHSARRLKGHRSICNHLRYAPGRRILASCGVEKIVKLWSGLELPGSYMEANLRELVVPPGNRIVPHPHVDGDEDEDLGMLAFFDRIILRARGQGVQDLVVDSSDGSGSDDAGYDFALDMDDDDDDDEEEGEGEGRLGRVLRAIILRRQELQALHARLHNGDNDEEEDDDDDTNDGDDDDDVASAESSNSGGEDLHAVEGDPEEGDRQQQPKTNRRRRASHSLDLNEDEEEGASEPGTSNSSAGLDQHDEPMAGEEENEDDEEDEEREPIGEWPPPAREDAGDH